MNENTKLEAIGSVPQGKHVFDDLSNSVIGAAVHVHKQLGPGFMETVYEEALRIEMRRRGIAFESQKQIPVLYDGQVVGNHVLDLLVEGLLVVELKAVKALEDVHFAQLRSYLRATGAKVGLLLNFNSPTLVVKRVVF
jgi:GxxExxY protein